MWIPETIKLIKDLRDTVSTVASNKNSFFSTDNLSPNKVAEEVLTKLLHDFQNLHNLQSSLRTASAVQDEKRDLPEKALTMQKDFMKQLRMEDILGSKATSKLG